MPISIIVLFLYVISTNLKRNIQDIAITFFGIFYIVIFLMYISVIREDLKNGAFLIWYVFFTAWGTDIFAYIVGKWIGKHHFTQISPNKTIEGCIGGVFGAILLTTIYTATCQFIFHIEFNYLIMGIICFVLSLLSQIGDLAASSIKRYTGIKDFSNLIPGHGGMLDRIDSIIFIAPFAYFLFMLI
ncbi:MAG: phosphatidate cytidylyltransferase [Clostridia bacterium]|nr:phosphatidate cytidylyltransferase [Clostridia bacterium]